MPVQGPFPRLVYQTAKKMDDINAPDMLHGDETKEKIETYGFITPFKKTSYTSQKEGYTIHGEDQFSLPAAEHFKRMRDLQLFFSNPVFDYRTSDVFSKMVDKFELNEGGYYMHPLLDDGLRDHHTTAIFNAALKQCLGENIKSGVLDKNIVSMTSKYMLSDKGAGLPKFDKYSEDLINGTVLTVNDIWSMRVYVDELEYKEDQVRGKFRYEIQDHFGLDTPDIDSVGEEGGFPPYELLDGFRSWYLLQHYQGYNYQPFITYIRFKL